MTTTTNLSLKKPSDSDFADIPTIYNFNMDTIDAAIGAINNKGAANAGKFLVVGNDGSVTLLTVSQASGGTY